MIRIFDQNDPLAALNERAVVFQNVIQLWLTPKCPVQGKVGVTLAAKVVVVLGNRENLGDNELLLRGLRQ